MKTIPGKGFFLNFRFYGPKRKFHEQNWVLDDLKKNQAESEHGSIRSKQCSKQDQENGDTTQEWLMLHMEKPAEDNVD